MAVLVVGLGGGPSCEHGLLGGLAIRFVHNHIILWGLGRTALILIMKLVRELC